MIAGSIAIASPASIVDVYVNRIEPNSGLSWHGVGFFLDTNHVITCKHVVRQSDRDPTQPIRIFMNGKYSDARIIAMSDKHDLALLYVDKPIGRPLRLCDNLIKRDRVNMITLEDNKLVSKRGVVKKMLLKGVELGDFESNIKAIHGNSGSPVFKNGCVVGMSYAINDNGVSFSTGTYNIRLFIYEFMTTGKNL